jgi:hypothetical protein
VKKSRCCQRGAPGARAGQHEFGYEATLRHIGGLKPTASLRSASCLPSPPPSFFFFIVCRCCAPNSTCFSQRAYCRRSIDKVIAFPHLDPRHPRPPDPRHPRRPRATTTRARRALRRRRILQGGGISARISRAAPRSRQLAPPLSPSAGIAHASFCSTAPLTRHSRRRPTRAR